MVRVLPQPPPASAMLRPIAATLLSAAACNKSPRGRRCAKRPRAPWPPTPASGGRAHDADDAETELPSELPDRRQRRSSRQPAAAHRERGLHGARAAHQRCSQTDERGTDPTTAARSRTQMHAPRARTHLAHPLIVAKGNNPDVSPLSTPLTKPAHLCRLSAPTRSRCNA